MEDFKRSLVRLIPPIFYGFIRLLLERLVAILQIQHWVLFHLRRDFRNIYNVLSFRKAMTGDDYCGRVFLYAKRSSYLFALNSSFKINHSLLLNFISIV
jgi:hypothetical protein